MPDIRVRELRNDLSSVLRRVQAGERLRVTLRGRPVADLVPVASRAPTMAWPAFWSALAQSQADPGMRGELQQAVQSDTDDLPIE